MTYFGTSVLLIFILALIGGGWYFLFKRFERRMSARFDDLVERSEEVLKSFSDIVETLGTIIHNVALLSQELAERIQNVKLDAEKMLLELEKADKKLDINQGLALLIKQDSFLEHARFMAKMYRETGRIDEESLAKLEKLINEMKLENYSRY